LHRLSALLRDGRVIAILSEFLRHHHTGGGATDSSKYRGELTLDTMRNVVMSLLSHNIL